MGVLNGAQPRREVLENDLDDAIVAADFGDLISGDAPNVYKKSAAFFQNTHPATALRRVTASVFQRLADTSAVTETSWWLALLRGSRPTRALRILLGAVR